MTAEGVLLIDSREHRTQAQNREAARERLAELVRLAEVRPKRRRKTRAPRAAKERRLETKTRRGRIKAGRGRVGDTDWRPETRDPSALRRLGMTGTRRGGAVPVTSASSPARASSCPVISQRISDAGIRPTALNSSMNAFIVNFVAELRLRSAISASISIFPIR